MGIASGKNNSVVTLHTLLSDMPSADNEDHDGRYYTETEVNTILGDYFLEDGQSDNIVNGTFDLTTTGKLGATVLENTAGDLKLQPDATGDVVLFKDTDVLISSRKFKLYQRHLSGDSYFEQYIDGSRVGRFNFHGDKACFFSFDNLLGFQSVNAGLRFYANDDSNAIVFGKSNTNQKIQFSGTITSLGAGKYIQHTVADTGYYETTPEDANVLGWNIGMDVAIDGDITADNLGTASAQDVGYFEPAKGTDDNFVTDYQLSILSTLVSHTWVNS